MEGVHKEWIQEFFSKWEPNQGDCSPDLLPEFAPVGGLGNSPPDAETK